MDRRRNFWIGAVSAVHLLWVPMVVTGEFIVSDSVRKNRAAPQKIVGDESLSQNPEFAGIPIAPAGFRDRFEAPLPPEDTTQVVVLLKSDTDVVRFAQAHGLTVVRSLRSNPDGYVLNASSAATARVSLSTLTGDARVRFGGLNERRGYVRTAFTPDDPYFHKDTPTAGFPGQWHLINEHGGPDAGVQGAW